MFFTGPTSNQDSGSFLTKRSVSKGRESDLLTFKDHKRVRVDSVFTDDEEVDDHSLSHSKTYTRSKIEKSFVEPPSHTSVSKQTMVTTSSAGPKLKLTNQNRASARAVSNLKSIKTDSNVIQSAGGSSQDIYHRPVSQIIESFTGSSFYFVSTCLIFLMIFKSGIALISDVVNNCTCV